MKDKIAELLFPNIDKTPEYYENKYPQRNLDEFAMVTRFGPSPTGFVHMGSLLTAFINYVYAKTTGGVFFLRIEDTDSKRKVENGAEGILNDLKAFDITPDESLLNGGEYGSYVQSERTVIYQTFVKDLIKKGLAYPCFLTKEEMETIRTEQELIKTKIGIYGHYATDRDLTYEEIKEKIDKGLGYVIRLKSSGNSKNEIIVHDEIIGNIKFPENDLDIVLLKNDLTPTYHLAHVIDDHLMRTTHVIRGNEWISSLPVHIQLFNILGFTPVKYAHVSTVNKKDESGNIRKLSKRLDPEAKVSYYEEIGIPVEAVKLYLATLTNTNFEEWYDKTDSKDILEFPFNFSNMSKSGSLFDLDKLNNIAKIYFSRKTAKDIFDETLIYTNKFDKEYYQLLLENKDDMIKFLNIEKDGPRPRKDIAKYSDVKNEFLYAIDELFIKDNYSQIDKSQTYDIELLKDYIHLYNINDSKDEWFEKVKEFSKQHGYCDSVKEYKKNPDDYKGHVGDVCQVIRIMVTGRTKSPDLYEILKILGTDRLKKRLELFEKVV